MVTVVTRDEAGSHFALLRRPEQDIEIGEKLFAFVRVAQEGEFFLYLFELLRSI